MRLYSHIPGVCETFARSENEYGNNILLLKIIFIYKLWSGLT